MQKKFHPRQVQNPDHPCCLRKSPPRLATALPPTELRPVDTLEQLAHVRSHLLKHRHDSGRLPQAPLESNTNQHRPAPARNGRGRGRGNGNYVVALFPARGNEEGEGSSGSCHAFRLPRDFFPEGVIGACAFTEPGVAGNQRREKKQPAREE